MHKSSVKIPLRRVLTEMSEELLEAIDGWRSKQKPIPSRAAAIRELLRMGLVKKEEAPC